MNQLTRIIFSAKLFCTIMTTALLILPLKAQSPDVLTLENRKQLEDLAQRTMIVILEKEQEDLLEQLNRRAPEKAAVYQKQLNHHNQYLKQLVKKYWKLNSEIEFRTLEDVKALSKKERSMFSILSITSYDFQSDFLELEGNIGRAIDPDQTVSDTHIDLFYNYDLNKAGAPIYKSRGLVFGWYSGEDFALRPSLSNLRTTLSKPAFEQHYPFKRNKFEKLDDPAFFNCFFDFHFSLNRAIRKNLPQYLTEQASEGKAKMKAITLYISEKWINEKKFSAKDIEASYPYDLQIVDHDTFSKLLLEGGQGKGFLFSYFDQDHNYIPYQLVIDGEDGQILGFSPRSNIRSALVQKKYVSKKVIKDIVK